MKNHTSQHSCSHKSEHKAVQHTSSEYVCSETLDPNANRPLSSLLRGSSVVQTNSLFVCYHCRNLLPLRQTADSEVSHVIPLKGYFSVTVFWLFWYICHSLSDRFVSLVWAFQPFLSFWFPFGWPNPVGLCLLFWDSFRLWILKAHLSVELSSLSLSAFGSNFNGTIPDTMREIYVCIHRAVGPLLHEWECRIVYVPGDSAKEVVSQSPPTWRTYSLWSLAWL